MDLCNGTEVFIMLLFHYFSASYDLNELSGKEYTVEHDKQTYKFGICTDVKASCGVNVGACSTTGGQKSSMGTMNNELLLSEEEKSDAPYLLYKSGGVCGDLSKQWNTKIEFVCQTDGMVAGPKIIEDSNCTLIIHFVTKNVCKNEVGFVRTRCIEKCSKIEWHIFYFVHLSSSDTMQNQ